MENRKVQLAELIETPITGEWGNEITDVNNQHIVKVIRTTNFTNNGEIDYSDITLRDIEYTKCEKKKLKYGDIILEKSGGTDLNPVGRVVFFDKNDPNDVYLTNNFTTTLRVKDNKINSRFLLLFLLYNYKYKGVHKFYNKTTGIQNLQVSNLIKNTYVPLPEIKIQSAIVEILDKIKNMIKKREKQILLFDELVKSRFIEMFGDPIKNEKGWDKIFIEEIASLVSRGKTPKYVEKSKIGVINQACIYWEKIKFENIKYHEDKKDILILQDQDILINSTGTGTLGRVNIFIKNKEKDIIYTIDTHITLLRLKQWKSNSIYLKNYFRIPIIQKYLINKCVNGSTNQIELSKEKFNNFRVLLPPLSLQNEFAEFVEKTNKLKFLYNLKRYISINLLKKLIIEILFFLTFLTFSANIRLDIELAEREEKMKYYRRSIEQVINEYKEQFPILLLTGPRQVGKSTLFKELFQSEYKYFSLDDPILKEQLINDPRLFLKNNPEKLIIDEIQYAPSIFPYLKMKVDENREDGMYLMTGSQAFVLMKNVSETLAGRVGILELQGISLREQFNIEFNKPFIPSEEYISEREKNITEYTNLWQRIHRGYMPELVFNDKKKWEFFYSSYVQTYIERDVRDLINISDESKFLKFMISLASRSGELLNYGAVANEVGVSNETVKRWVSVLRTSRIIYLMEPYFNNHLKRVIKTPKIYFMDVGLLAYLTKWPTPETLANGAKAGNIFETFVVSEIIKSYLNAGIINPPIYFYRDKDKKEIDLIIEEAEKIYPIEIKMSASPDKEMAKNFSVLKGKIDKEIGTGIIICQYDNKVYLSEDILVLPIEYI